MKAHRVHFFRRNITDEELLSRVGYDAYMVLRLPVFALRLCCHCMPFGFAAIIVNVVAGGRCTVIDRMSPNNCTVVGTLDGMSIAAVEVGSPWLWAFVPLGYSITFIISYLLRDEELLFIRLRHRFLRRPQPEDFSVLVMDLPRRYRTNPAL